MPAILGLHRILGVFALLQLGRGGIEFRHHIAIAEITEVPAVAGRRIGGFLLGQLGEIGAALKLFDDCLGLVLGLHQDVAGSQLLARRHFRDLVGVALFQIADDLGHFERILLGTVAHLEAGGDDA